MTVRDVRVRKRLHELDRTRSSYPSVARTGDPARLGKNPFFYDDTNTIVFVTNKPITYPTTFHAGNARVVQDLTSSLTAMGNTNRSSVEQWAVRDYDGPSIAPFSENRLFEQDILSSSFYLTGSRTADVGLGFTSKLGSKTIIRLELPLTSKSTLLALTASSYYYNAVTKNFEVWNRYNGVYDFAQDLDDTGLKARNIPQPREELLFGPLGKHSTHIVNRKSGGSLIDGAPLVALGDIFFRSQYSSPLTSSLTTPTASNKISMSTLISQPFMLEKCIVEIPFEAGAGWFDDPTLMSGYTENTLDAFSRLDIGGPAITFGMFNHLGGDQKDLILSGVIIPSPDNRSDLVMTAFSWPLAGGQPTKTFRAPVGYKSYGETATVVQKPANSQFTGSVRLHMKAAVSVGVNSFYHRLAPGRKLSSFNSASFDQTTMMIQTTAGRSKVAGNGGLENITGRTIFGKSTVCPPLTNIDFKSRNVWLTSGTISGVEDIPFYSTEIHQPAPYLLFPKDNLFFTLSKYRSTFNRSSDAGSAPDAVFPPPALAVDSGYWIYQSSSHDVGISTGTMRVTLYGSMISEGNEYHDVLNSRLDTDQVHEMIGSEPILDQFDVHYLGELTGTYLDDFITGSIFKTDNNARQLVFSNIFPDDGLSKAADGSAGKPFDVSSLAASLVLRSEYAGNPRVSQVVSSDERFWDSLPPDIYRIYRQNGGTIISRFLSSSIGLVLPTFTFDFGADDTIGDYADVNWTKSYPFESRYSSIPRLSSFNTILNEVTNRYETTDRSFYILHNGNIFGDMTVANFNANLGLATFTNFLGGLSRTELTKWLFGIGDRSAFIFIGGETFLAGNSQTPNFKIAGRDDFYSDTFKFGVQIRGWKYGLLNALPTYTKCLYRRNRYGQMRDMLEQRLDGTFFTNFKLDPAVQVRFLGSDGTVITPLETDSSNVSFDVTSSLPYFDGRVRNRENPITFSV